MKKNFSFWNDNRLNTLGVFVLVCLQTLLSTICHLATRITTFAYKTKNFGSALKKLFCTGNHVERLKLSKRSALCRLKNNMLP